MRAVLTAALWLTLAHASIAGPPPDDGCRAGVPPPRDMVTELTHWIGENTNYDISRTLQEPPRVSFCKTGEAIVYEGDEMIVDPRLKAAYDLSERRIFLVLPWDAGDPRDASALLHELIHDIQLLNRDWPCLGAPEWEAYKLQAAWLREQGVESDFDWLHIYMRARCPRDIHPD